MAVVNHTAKPEQQSGKKAAWLAVLFLVIAGFGLFYVKWWPYYEKSLLAAHTHSIGTSILGDPGKSASFSWDGTFQYVIAYFQAVWKAAVLGILLGSLVQVLLPSAWLLKVLGKTSFGSTVIAGASAIPGMMCTCCAAPIAVGLRKKQVSTPAALAFWIGNPMLNPATLIFMAFVLSWKFTLLRIVAGLIMTFGVSWLAGRLVKNEQPVNIRQFEPDAGENNGSFFLRWGKAAGNMILYLVPAYLLSVVVLSAARFWLFPAFGQHAGNSITAVILLALAGMLFVIPTAAEIPIVQTMMAFGLGTGPASALLVTLPAISLPSLIMVGRSFSKQTLLFVAASCVVVGIVAGLCGMFF
ncbi:permease [Heyndrickxia faecalis]|uniref:Permease n=1 Tax=Heyndrickxia faecalis TaxID=2824910 RepID=A0AAU7WCR9_9BACI|nr:MULTISPECIES: permease [Heyndrickxia]MDT9755974.1 permease [Heyndrickxia coagulans]